MAKKMGDREVADTYLKRAGAYKHLVDERLGFIRPKNAAGQMKEKFDVLDTHGQGFIEGNSWNYSFYVPQDVNGLKAFMGGDKRFIGWILCLPWNCRQNTTKIPRILPKKV